MLTVPQFPHVEQEDIFDLPPKNVNSDFLKKHFENIRESIISSDITA